MTLDAAARPPYPGLRSFLRDETDLFFGREGCTHAMVDRLADVNFLAVLGSSGTGKSSIVKTGLLDALEGGLMEKAGSRWRIIDFRPGGSPLRNLARELLATEAPGAEPTEMEINLLRGSLARGPRSIIEWCYDGNLPRGANLLLLVDQFEELFRYQDYAGKEEAEAFVALLLESAHSPEFPLYVALTMRSEYLGACALIEGLAETISRGMVLTPRMTREQCRDAIEGPARVCGVDIEQPLVNRLLNDLANFAPWDDHGSDDQLDRLVRRADQLPLLQYTLNRLWLRARGRGGAERIKLRLSDYEAIGGLRGALDAHGNQLLEELKAKGRAGAAEKLFRALMSGATIAEAVRKPTKFGALVKLCDGDQRAVEDVLYAFCAPGCNFLTPELRDPGAENRKPLDAGLWIDISHESLIRQWKMMSIWLEKETRAAQNWRRLKDRMADGDLLRGRELANLAAWRDEMKPSEEWAKRYGGGHKEAVEFLDKSERKQRLRNYQFFGSLAVAVLLLTVSGFLLYAREKAVAARAVEALAIADIERTKAQSAATAAETAKTEAEEARAAAEAAKQKEEEAKQSFKKLLDSYNKKSAEMTLATKVPLGPPPSSDDYAGEVKDYHVDPPAELQKDVSSPTPKSLPGGNVLSTRQIYAALAAGAIEPGASGKKISLPFVLVDVDSEDHSPTLPTAQRLPYAGGGALLTDNIQKKLFDDLSSIMKKWDDGIVFFGRDAKSWGPYNAAVRAIQMGFPNVFWYRGGIASWKAADQPLKP